MLVRAVGKSPAMETKVQFVSTQPNIVIPFRGTELSAGIDFFPPSNLEIQANTIVEVNTRIKFLEPFKGFGLIADRSSIFLQGIRVFRGIVDGDYEGEIKVLLQNFSSETKYIPKSKAMAQMIIFELNPLIESVSACPMKRGAGGFGSTVSYYLESTLQKCINCYLYFHFKKVGCLRKSSIAR